MTRRLTCIVHKEVCFLGKNIYLLSFGLLTEHQAAPGKAGKENEGTAIKYPLGTSHMVTHLNLTVIYRGELLLAFLYGRGN